MDTSLFDLQQQQKQRWPRPSSVEQFLSHDTDFLFTKTEFLIKTR